VVADLGETLAPRALHGRLRAALEALGDIFWIRPALLVLGGTLLGQAMVMVEQAEARLPWLPDGWLYAGGEAGARDMLGAVAASTIGVAGTTFSITVAALSLASGQMGPRLLRNFVRDPGNQVALGIFLGTFAYSLVVLRTVRSVEEGSFVPQLGVTLALLMALACVATLVWFVHHIASSINVETVIEASTPSCWRRWRGWRRAHPRPAPRPRRVPRWRSTPMATCARWTRTHWPTGRPSGMPPSFSVCGPATTSSRAGKSPR